MISENLLIDLEEIVNEGLKDSSIPYAKGNSIRIKQYIVRKSKVGYLVYDSSANKQIHKTQFKSVAIAIAYDSFFRDKTNEIVNNQAVSSDLNIFAEFTLRFSNESPLLYGAFAIILAITLGALAAWMRRFMSPIVKKLLSDFRDKNKTKKEEVKFPEK